MRMSAEGTSPTAWSSTLHLAAAAPFTALTQYAPARLTRLTSRGTRLTRAQPLRRTQGYPRTVEPAPTRATSGKPSHPDATLTATRDENPDDHRNDHDGERSGLNVRACCPAALRRGPPTRRVGGPLASAMRLARSAEVALACLKIVVAVQARDVPVVEVVSVEVRLRSRLGREVLAVLVVAGVDRSADAKRVGTVAVPVADEGDVGWDAIAEDRVGGPEAQAVLHEVGAAAANAGRVGAVAVPVADQDDVAGVAVAEGGNTLGGA